MLFIDILSYIYCYLFHEVVRFLYFFSYNQTLNSYENHSYTLIKEISKEIIDFIAKI